MNLRQLPFDQYGRYQIIGEALDAAAATLGRDSLRILDVGGYFQDYTGAHRLPAPAFLARHDVTVLDRPDVSLPNYVRGDGNRLQFADTSFDFVITCDTLEHIPAADRAGFIGELLRTALYGVLLICPMADARVVLAEQIVSAYILAEIGVEQPQLAEHSDYGLPQLPIVQELFAQAGCATHAYPSGNVFAWLPMMLAKHYLAVQGDDPALHTGLDELYNLSYGTGDRREPAYRHLVVAARDNQGGWLAAVDAALAPTVLPAATDDSGQWLGLTQQLFGLIQLRLGERVADRREAALRMENQYLKELTNHLREQIATLDRVLADQASHIHHLNAQNGDFTGRAGVYLEALRWREGQVEELNKKVAWLEQQANDARRELELLKNGTLMRLARRFQG